MSFLGERRSELRKSDFIESCRLKLTSSKDVSQSWEVLPLDVSSRGLGFLVQSDLKVGEFYILDIGGEGHRVEIAYCTLYQTDPGPGEWSHRCGVFLREPTGDLKIACKNARILLEP